MSKCGRCKGRGYVKPTRGFGDQECPGCKGTGVKVHKHSLGARTVSIPLTPGARCKVCGELAVQNHHIVSQGRIDRMVKDGTQKCKADPRNSLAVCYGCHDQITQASLRVEPHQLHPQFWAFVREYDLLGAVDQHLAERMPA